MALFEASDTIMTILSVSVVAAVLGHSLWNYVHVRRKETRIPVSGVDNSKREASVRQQQQESGVEPPAERIEALNIRVLAPSDRAEFVKFWTKVQTTFADDPGSAVRSADQLLGNVMSSRGFPMGNFEQRVAEISVGYPDILDNYRAAHQRALRHMRGRASSEDLRQAMFHYQALFEELIKEPQ